MKNLNQHGRSLAEILKQGPPKYNEDLLPLYRDVH
jgi:hypothetical protein